MVLLIKKIEEWMGKDRIGFIPHAALYALSLAYGAVVRLRLLMYNRGVLKSEKLPCPVISVGNMTVGGTGKTPVTMCLASLLRDMGKRVVILSRGYKRKGKDTAVVSNGKDILLGPEEAGDEPYLMAKRLKGVPVIVGPDRVRSGRFAISEFSPDVMILDDGYQHIRLQRDINILLSGRSGMGRFLLPRGVLREPLEGVRRATFVMVRGLNNDDKKTFRKYGKVVIEFRYRPFGLYDISTGETIGPENVKGKKVAAFCGLANPDSFFATLESLGARITGRHAFPDHHWYSQKDMITIKEIAVGADLVITTEKDGVKLKGLLPGVPVHALAIDAEITGKGRLRKLLSPVLGGTK